MADTDRSDFPLDIAGIVVRLRELRERALASRQRQGRPPRLPTRASLEQIVEGLGTAMFPFRLGLPGANIAGIDFHVGHALDTALRALAHEIRRELAFVTGAQADIDACRLRSEDLTRAFSERLPAVRALLDSDILAAFRGDPAARSIDEVLVCYPGITAVIHHRLAHELHRLGIPLCARIIAEIAHASTGIDIHPGAEIGESFFIDHGTGVVIGETAVIGRNVRLYHGVTLGAKRFPVGVDGSLVKGIPRHPIVEDDVVIYASATILGRITIGRGATIGGNAWVTRDVPPGSSLGQSQAHPLANIDGDGI